MGIDQGYHLDQHKLTDPPLIVNTFKRSCGPQLWVELPVYEFSMAAVTPVGTESFGEQKVSSQTMVF